MPRKRAPSAKKKKSTGRSTPAKGNSRADRATASRKAPKPKRSGTKRASAAEITARNAVIVKLREVHRLMWEEIGAEFGIDEKTARAGYDAHVAARVHEVNFKQAMKDMREYVAVVVVNQQELAKIIHGASGAADAEATKSQADDRTRIIAMHEMVELIFREISLRQAVGDLPASFSELSAAKNFEGVLQQIMEVLKEHQIPHKVFVAIEERLMAHSNVTVPKTHLTSVG